MSPTVSAEDDVDAAFMPMTLIKAGYGSGYSYETKKWSLIKTGFTKIAVGDIAFAKITPCFQNRKSFILGDVPGKVAAATTELNVLRLYGKTLNVWYVLYFLKSDYFIKEAKYKGTAGQQRVLSTYIQKKLFPIPPYNEQCRLIEKIQEVFPVIDKYDKYQKELDKLNDLICERLRKAILQEAIQGKLVPQIEEEGTTNELLELIRQEKQRLAKEGKLKKSALSDSIIYKGDDNKYYEQIGNKHIEITNTIPFDIPLSWQWIRLGTLFTHCTGKALNASNKEGVLKSYITTSNLYWNYFVLDKLKQMPFTENELDKCTVTYGDLLVCEGGDIGRAAIWREDYDICIQNHVHKLRSFISSCTMFYFYVFYFYKLVGYIGGKGIGIQGLSSRALDQLIIPLPPKSEQERIVEKIKKLFDKIKGYLP